MCVTNTVLVEPYFEKNKMVSLLSDWQHPNRADERARSEIKNPPADKISAQNSLYTTSMFDITS
jgi:hypothetical protein